MTCWIVVWAHSNRVNVCHLATGSGTKICLKGGPGAKLTPGPTRTPPRESSGGPRIFVPPITARMSRTNSPSPTVRSNAGARPRQRYLPRYLNPSPAAIDSHPSDLGSTAVNYKSGLAAFPLTLTFYFYFYFYFPRRLCLHVVTYHESHRFSNF